MQFSLPTFRGYPDLRARFEGPAEPRGIVRPVLGERWTSSSPQLPRFVSATVSSSGSVHHVRSTETGLVCCEKALAGEDGYICQLRRETMTAAVAFQHTQWCRVEGFELSYRLGTTVSRNQTQCEQSVATKSLLHRRHEYHKQTMGLLKNKENRLQMPDEVGELAH